MPEEDRAAPPPSKDPHSDFPLPESWADALPIILWGMLALGFALVITDSLMAVIVNPIARAGAAFVALLGLTALLIYRGWLWQKFSNPSPGLIAAVLCTLLWVLAASPFVEQRRWPFTVWFQGSQAAAEAQKSTLIEWLQQAQRERDQAIERNRFAPSTASQPNALNAAVEATKRLPSTDRERLADTLYDVSQLLDRALKLANDASTEVDQIELDFTTSTTIPISAEQLEVHRQRLASLSESVTAYWTDFDAALKKWKYYKTQISYIVGTTPDENIALLRNAIDDYAHYFDAWSKIKNIEEPEIRQLILYQRSPFHQSISGLYLWQLQYSGRFQEIKDALQRA